MGTVSLDLRDKGEESSLTPRSDSIQTKGAMLVINYQSLHFFGSGCV